MIYIYISHYVFLFISVHVCIHVYVYTYICVCSLLLIYTSIASAFLHATISWSCRGTGSSKQPVRVLKSWGAVTPGRGLSEAVHEQHGLLGPECYGPVFL